MNIVFMGTPDFAVVSLERLAESRHRLLAAVTSTDKPKGRGLHLQVSPVKLAAQKLGLPVLQVCPEVVAILKLPPYSSIEN